MNTNRCRLAILILVMGLIFVGCKAGQLSAPTATTILVPTLAAMPTLTPSPMPVPTLTSTPTLTPSPTPTLTLSPTLVPYSNFTEIKTIESSNPAGAQWVPVSAELSPDGSLIAFTSINIVDIKDFKFDYKLTAIKSDSEEVLYTFKLDQIPHNYGSYGHFLAFSPNSQFLASAVNYKSSMTSLDSYSLQLWNLTNGKLVRTANALGLNGLVFNSDGTLLGAPSFEGIYLWDAHNLDVKAHLQSAYRWGFAFHPNSSQFATRSDDNTIHIVDIASKKDIDQFAENISEVNTIAYSPDGNLLAFSGFSGTDYYSSTKKPGDFSIMVWDVKSKKLKMAFPLTGYTGMVKSLAFSPDGNRLATLGLGSQCPLCPVEYKEDQFIRIWDITSGKKVRDITMKGGISSISFNSDWTKMITLGALGGDGSMILWQIK